MLKSEIKKKTHEFKNKLKNGNPSEPAKLELIFKTLNS
jgi:hypothetical protein